MNIEIRRNYTINFTASIEPSDEALRLISGQPQLTTEQRKIMEQGEQMIRSIKEKIWAYIDEHPTIDLDGRPLLQGQAPVHHHRRDDRRRMYGSGRLSIGRGCRNNDR